MLRATRGSLALLLAAAAAALAPLPSSAQAPVAPAAVEVPAGVVALVRRDDGSTFSAIGEAQYTRFFSTALSQSQQRPIAKAIPLVPPDFVACVDGKRWFEGGAAPRTRAARRRVCARTYEQVRNTAVAQLLSLNWIAAELDRRAIVFTERRMARELRDLIATFEGKRGYRRFLRESGLSQADVDLNVLASLGQKAIIKQVYASTPKFEDPTKQLEAEQVSIDEFRTEFLLRSAAATTCAAAYAALPACTGEPIDDLPENDPEQPETIW